MAANHPNVTAAGDLGIYLPGKIDLQGAVDADEIGDGGMQEYVMSVAWRAHLEQAIAVRPAVNSPRPEQRGGDAFAGISGFFAVGDHTRFYKIDDTISDRPGMQAQISLADQALQ